MIRANQSYISTPSLKRMYACSRPHVESQLRFQLCGTGDPSCVAIHRRVDHLCQGMLRPPRADLGGTHAVWAASQVIIRQAIEREATRESSRPPLPDRAAWEEVVRLVELRKTPGARGKAHHWNRQDAHEDGESSFTRISPRRHQPLDIAFVVRTSCYAWQTTRRTCQEPAARACRKRSSRIESPPAATVVVER